MNYYNENDPYCVQWLENLIHAELIPFGHVDDRDIRNVHSSDLKGYSQCHFFAGIAGWSLALQMAGWPKEEKVWTGSCPCQPFSGASRGRGIDKKDLWPEFYRIISSGKPSIVFGEQVPHAKNWFDEVCNDMEALDYEIGAAVLSAISVGKDHKRSRIFFVCHSNGHGKPVLPFNAKTSRVQRYCGFSKKLVQKDGIPSRMAIRGFGNAIVPQVAAFFIRSYMERT